MQFQSILYIYHGIDKNIIIHKNHLGHVIRTPKTGTCQILRNNMLDYNHFSFSDGIKYLLKKIVSTLLLHKSYIYAQKPLEYSFKAISMLKYMN